ncbi:MAG: serine hydrolase [Gammaproteobacteria bacterium]|nr:serine hydrolase [Gammaproteobacteria bacterium]
MILNDTDHLWGIGGDELWVWKTFCRGQDPIFMDPYQPAEEGATSGAFTDHMGQPRPLDLSGEPLRLAMGRTLELSRRIDLRKAEPHAELTSSRYCLSEPGRSYLIFSPAAALSRSICGTRWATCRPRGIIRWPAPIRPDSASRAARADARSTVRGSDRAAVAGRRGAVMLSALALACLLPAAPWPTATPEEVGLRPLALEAFSRYVGGRGCLVRHGRMVYTWGDATTPGDVASAAKPVYAHFLFKALEQGRIASVDGAVAALEPRLSGADAGITWRHLATQTSCYGVAEAPGTAYCYNDWQMALFWDLLFLKVYGSDYEHVDEQVLHPLLTDPLGCEDRPTLMAFGTGNRPGRLAISPRDFARFGMLYLHGGEFGGQRLLREDLARLAVSEPLPNELPQSTGEAAPLLPGQRSLGSTRVPDNQTEPSRQLFVALVAERRRP